MGGAPSHFSKQSDIRWGSEYKFINYLSKEFNLPQNALSSFQQILRSIPSNAVSELIVDKLNALTLVEYVLEYVRFNITEPSDLPIDEFERMFQMHKDIRLVEYMLREAELLDENQARRVEAAYLDIFAAMMRSARLQTSGTASGDASSEESPSWQPMYKSDDFFVSETKKNFMSGLQHLNVASRTLSAQDIYQQLADICMAVSHGHIYLSDVEINIVVRTVIVVLSNAAEKVTSPEAITGARYHILTSFFDKFYRSAVLDNKKIDCACYEYFVILHFELLNGLLDYAYINFQESRPSKIGKPNQHQYVSPFWERLQCFESLSELLMLSEQQCCVVCKSENIRPNNFAILDKCFHALCVECIETCFETSALSPCCQTRTIVWTTRDEFLAFTGLPLPAGHVTQADVGGAA